VREQLRNQVRARELVADTRPRLLSRQQDETVRSLEQDQRCSLIETCSTANIGWDHESPPVSHHDSVCPIHDLIVPLTVLLWYVAPTAREWRPSRAA
jgi:hypothetical protein